MKEHPSLPILATFAIALFTNAAANGEDKSSVLTDHQAQWTLQHAKVIAEDTLEIHAPGYSADPGTLITIRLPLNDSEGTTGRAFVTPQSPFVVSKSGDLFFWSAWMNSSPEDNAPGLWQAETPASIEIEINERKGGSGKINTRAIKATGNITLTKVDSDRTIRYVDDKTIEISLFFQIKQEDIASVGTITYSTSSTKEFRAQGIKLSEIKAWLQKTN